MSGSQKWVQIQSLYGLPSHGTFFNWGVACGDEICADHASCEEETETCQCDEGFEFDFGKGDGSCRDINECAINNFCGEHMDCTNTVGSVTCECSSGFVENGDKCDDINECDNNPCPANSDCTNTIGDHICTCHEGFKMDNESGNCVDVDECEFQPCGVHSICTNTVGVRRNLHPMEGSFACTCETGYEPDTTTEDNTCTYFFL